MCRTPYNLIHGPCYSVPFNVASTWSALLDILLLSTFFLSTVSKWQKVFCRHLVTAGTLRGTAVAF